MDEHVELPPAYEALAEVGRGGFGVVYKARHKPSGRDVALKLLLPAGEAQGARMLREARLAASCKHPNLVEVIDSGTYGERPYVAFAFVSGGTLTERMAKGPLPLGRALDLAVEILAALQYLHQSEIAHRDVKPQNVLIDEEGHALLGDLGLATAAWVTRMTEAGCILGTPGYLAPEVLKGQRADRRSDLYGFGAILYEMIEGRSPFPKAKDLAAFFQACMKEPPPPMKRLRAEGAQGALRRLVVQLLAKDPAARPASATVVAESLGALRAGVNDEPSVAKAGDRGGKDTLALEPVSGDIELLPKDDESGSLIASGEEALQRRSAERTVLVDQTGDFGRTTATVTPAESSPGEGDRLSSGMLRALALGVLCLMLAVAASLRLGRPSKEERTALAPSLLIKNITARPFSGCATLLIPYPRKRFPFFVQLRREPRRGPGESERKGDRPWRTRHDRWFTLGVRGETYVPQEGVHLIEAPYLCPDSSYSLRLTTGPGGEGATRERTTFNTLPTVKRTEMTAHGIPSPPLAVGGDLVFCSHIGPIRCFRIDEDDGAPSLLWRYDPPMPEGSQMRRILRHGDYIYAFINNGGAFRLNWRRRRREAPPREDGLQPAWGEKAFPLPQPGTSGRGCSLGRRHFLVVGRHWPINTAAYGYGYDFAEKAVPDGVGVAVVDLDGGRSLDLSWSVPAKRVLPWKLVLHEPSRTLFFIGIARKSESKGKHGREGLVYALDADGLSLLWQARLPWFPVDIVPTSRWRALVLDVLGDLTVLEGEPEGKRGGIAMSSCFVSNPGGLAYFKELPTRWMLFTLDNNSFRARPAGQLFSYGKRILGRTDFSILTSYDPAAPAKGARFVEVTPRVDAWGRKRSAESSVCVDRSAGLGIWVGGGQLARIQSMESSEPMMAAAALVVARLDRWTQGRHARDTVLWRYALAKTTANIPLRIGKYLAVACRNRHVELIRVVP